MSYTIEKHPTLPAVIATWHAGFNYTREAPAYVAEMHQLLNQQQTPIYYVLDLRAWRDMTLEELVQAANTATRSETSNFHHPMNKGNLVITNDPTVKLSVEGLRSDAFGNARITIFSTLEEALQHVQKEL